MQFLANDTVVHRIGDISDDLQDQLLEFKPQVNK